MRKLIELFKLAHVQGDYFWVYAQGLPTTNGLELAAGARFTIFMN